MPGFFDDVYINVAGASAYTVTLDIDATVGSLNLGATNAAAGRQTLSVDVVRQLTLNGSSTVNASGQLVLNGRLAGGGGLNVLGRLAWGNGVMDGSGRTLIQPGGVLDITGVGGQGTRYLQRKIVNNGTTIWGGLGLVTVQMSSSQIADFTNGAAGLFDLQGQGRFAWDRTGTPPSFTNSGMIRKSVSKGSLNFVGVRFNSEGVTEVLVGALRFQGGGKTFKSRANVSRTVASRAVASGGTEVPFQVAEGAELEFASDYTFSCASSIRGAGHARVTAGTVRINAGVGVDNLDMSGGTVDGGARLEIGKLMDWTAGAMLGRGSLTINPGARLNIKTATTRRLGRILQNSGLIVWSDRSTIDVAGSTFNNLPGGTFEIIGDGVWSAGVAAGSTGAESTTVPRINNRGAFRKAVGVQTRLLGVELINSGLVEAVGGVLDLGPYYQQIAGRTTLSGGSLAATSSSGMPQTLSFQRGVLSGSGQIKANVYNNGARVRPGHSPGTIEIIGNYTQTAAGTLDMEIAGLVAGTEYDQMIVSGMAQLAGALNLLRLSSFVPPDGTSFELIRTTTGLSGQFSSLFGVGIGGGRYLKPSYGESIFAVGTTVDSGYPTVGIATPVNGVVYPGATQPPLTAVRGTASDSLSGVDRVTIALARYADSNPATAPNGYLNWTTAGFALPYSGTNERVANGTTNWNLDLATLAAGYYGVRATARDLAGNVTSSNWVRFSIPTYFTLSGRITSSNGTGLAGVTVTRSGVTATTTTITNGNGEYSLPYAVPGTHTITPSKAGTVFAPNSIVISVTNANVSNLSFVALQAPAISGRVTNALGAGVGGITVTRTGGIKAVTNAYGYYGFSSVPISTASCVLTPSLSGATFSPSSRSILVSSATHYSGQNFGVGFSIRGRITNSAGVGVPGVLLTRTGATPATTVITDAGGNYTFTNVAANTTSYVITPALSGNVFLPASLTAKITNSSVVNISFVALSGAYIAGRVTNSAGAAVAGVSLTRVGSSQVAVTNTLGYYGFSSVLSSGILSSNFTISPALSGYVFQPGAMTVTVTSTLNGNANFIALQLPAISGRITNALGPVPGIVIARSGGATAMTNANGYYGFSAVPVSATAYVVTPLSSTASFTPTSRTVIVSGAAHFSNNDFGATYTISGKVTNSANIGLANVVVTRSHPTGTVTTTTSATGAYVFRGVAASNIAYSLSVNLAGYTFSPITKAVLINNAGNNSANFIGTPILLATSRTTQNTKPISEQKSSVQLSHAALLPTDNRCRIELAFTGDLSSLAANATEHYAVSVYTSTGQMQRLQISSAVYSPVNNSVIIELAGANIPSGEGGLVSCQGLRDAKNLELQSQSKFIVAH